MAFVVQQRALEAAAELQPLVRTIHKRDRSLADQIRRAASSVVLNISEADGNDAGTARARFATACGSAKEVRAALKLAAAWQLLPLAQAARAERLLDEVCAMTWRLSGR